jgi:hypothetical protein
LRPVAENGHLIVKDGLLVYTGKIDGDLEAGFRCDRDERFSSTPLPSVVRHPDPKRWDLERLAKTGTENRALAEQGLTEWADSLEREDHS